MKAFIMLFGLALVVSFAIVPASKAKDSQYVGVKSCGKCHKKEKAGKQLAAWEESGHSKTYELLGSDKAKEAAKKIGFDGDPQKSENCLVCHTTGYGEPSDKFGRKFKMENGVQCEACHGAGSLYKKKKIMKAIHKELGKDNKGDSPTAKETGYIVPNEETCKTCHVKERTFNGKTYKNPSFKEFDYKKKFDEIKHPVP